MQNILVYMSNVHASVLGILTNAACASSENVFDKVYKVTIKSKQENDTECSVVVLPGFALKLVAPKLASRAIVLKVVKEQNKNLIQFRARILTLGYIHIPGNDFLQRNLHKLCQICH